jgi:hypothetical protein
MPVGRRGNSKSEARISKQSPKAERFETALPFKSFSPLGNLNLFRISCFDIRIFTLVAVICSWQLATSAKAQAIATAPAVCSIDGLDCITSYEVEEEPAQVCDNSPNPWNGLGETASVTDDEAVIPSGDDKDPPQFTATTLDELTLRLLSISSLRQPERSPYHYCLLEHLRERAPPTLA